MYAIRSYYDLSAGQWREWRGLLCQAGWLLAREDGDHWQPWIAELLGLWREQPQLDWAPLSHWLAQWPLADIQALYPARPLPQLALSLFRITSYNVCYTKLLRVRCARPPAERTIERPSAPR